MNKNSSILNNIIYNNYEMIRNNPEKEVADTISYIDDLIKKSQGTIKNDIPYDNKSLMERFLIENNIKQLHISNKLDINNSLIFKDINIDRYNSIEENSIFFGIYDIKDYMSLINHKGKKWVIWAGNDADISNINRLIMMKKYIM